LPAADFDQAKLADCQQQFPVTDMGPPDAF
jgi:hypothetical protein